VLEADQSADVPVVFQHGIPVAGKDELTRHELLDALTRSHAPLVIIHGPLGFGKTVLASQYARRTPRVLWHSAHAREYQATLTQTLQRFTQEDGQAGLWVIDDAQALSVLDHARLSDWLRQRPEWHLMLVSRTDLTSSYTSLVVDGRAQVIPPDRLTFQPNEVETFWHGADTGAEGAALHGWPLGHALFRSLGTAAYQSLGQLLEETFPVFWPLLPSLALTPDWAQAVLPTGAPDLADGWLADLLASGFPLLRGAHDRLGPLPVVRTVLLQHLIRDPAAHLAVVAHLRYVTPDEPGRRRLVEHCVRFGFREDALALVHELADAYRASWNFSALIDLLGNVPVTWRDDRLAAMYGHALIETGQAAQGEVVLRRLNAGGYRDAEVLHALSALAGRQGQHHRQLRLAQESLDLGLPQDASWKLRRDCAYALLNLGDIETATRTAQQLVEECEDRDALEPLAENLCLMQVVHLKAGRLYAAEQCLKRALQLYAALGLVDRSLLLLNDLADLKRLQGDVQMGHQLIRQALDLCAAHPHPIAPVLEETRGDLLMMEQRYAEARLQYTRAADLCQQHLLEAVTQRVQFKLAETCCFLGEAVEADLHLRRARGSYAGNTALQYFYEGMLLFHQGNASASRAALTQASALGVSIDRRVRLHAMLAELHDEPAESAVHVQALRDLQAQNELHLPSLLTGEQSRLGGWLQAALTHAPQPAPAPVTVREPSLRIVTFGTLQVWYGDLPVRLPFAKAGELLLYLLLHGPTSKERIVDALWDGSAEKRHADYFKVSIRQLRLSLRSATGHETPIPHQAGRYALHPDLRIEADCSALGRALNSASATQLQEALSAYTGDFLPTSYATWACEVRAHMMEDAMTVALRLGHHPALDWQASVRAFERALEIDPMRDEPYQALIRRYEEIDNTEMARKYQRAWQKVLS